MNTEIKVSCTEAEEYFKKINDIFTVEPEAIITVDADFIKLIERKKVENTKLIFAFDLPIYKLISDNMIGLFSIDESNGTKYIHDFYFWKPGCDEVKICNIDYKPACNYYLFF